MSSVIDRIIRRHKVIDLRRALEQQNMTTVGGKKLLKRTMGIMVLENSARTIAKHWRRYKAQLRNTEDLITNNRVCYKDFRLVDEHGGVFRFDGYALYKWILKSANPVNPFTMIPLNRVEIRRLCNFVQDSRFSLLLLFDKRDKWMTTHRDNVNLTGYFEQNITMNMDALLQFLCAFEQLEYNCWHIMSDQNRSITAFGVRIGIDHTFVHILGELKSIDDIDSSAIGPVLQQLRKKIEDALLTDHMRALLTVNLNELVETFHPPQQISPIQEASAILDLLDREDQSSDYSVELTITGDQEIPTNVVSLLASILGVSGGEELTIEAQN